MKVYCVTWKDERWSADKESLKAINQMISKDTKTKKSLFHVINPQTILMWIFYGVGFLIEGVKFLYRKIFKRS